MNDMTRIWSLIWNLWLIGVSLMMMYSIFMDWRLGRPTGLACALLAFFTLGCIIIECAKAIKKGKWNA